mmetsp:Transcript_100739/g.159358  ORF Transcript_100739/g.159358 Transcript_100739/m.159358 type:complete len:969 (-) Transcript_100739:40-2946(-)
MQHVGIRRSVLGVSIVFQFILPGLSVLNLEELLSAQDAHETSARNDLVRVCQSAQSTLTDRISAQRERISELADSIESYTKIAGEVKNKTNKKGVQAFDTIGQEQRLQLIRTESQHWRGVHAKKTAEQLLNADDEMLSSLEKIMQWQEQVASKHHSVRQQIIALVRDKHLEGITNGASSVGVSHSEASSRNLTQTPPPSPLEQVQSNSSSSSLATSKKTNMDELVATDQPERVRPSVVRASSAVVLQVSPEVAPIFGVSQLPALQLMQAGSPKTEVVAQAPTPPAPPLQKSATELLMPMSSGAPLPDSTAPSPLVSLAGMSSGASTQAASALREISSQLFTERQMAQTSLEDAKQLQASQLPTVAPQVQPMSSPELRHPAPEVTVHPPKELVSAKVAKPVPLPKNASPQQIPLATTLAAAVEKAIPMPAPVEKVPAREKESLPAQKPALIQSAVSSPANQDDPEDALMAIMTGSSIGSASTSLDESNTAPVVTIPAPSSTKMSASFLAIRTTPAPISERHLAAATPAAATPAAGPEDPEDALMEVMLQGGTTNPKPSSTLAPKHSEGSSDEKSVVRKHPAPVLAQTAQQIHSAIGKKRTSSKVIKLPERIAAVQKPLALDSTAGAMKNFIQEVSDLAQGEPGDSQADPAEPVKRRQQQEKQESEASMMNSFVQEVTRLAQGEPTPQENSASSKPTTAAGLALSSDLASLMGLSDGSSPASFLQLTRGASSRSELAAAALIKDLDASEVSKRLARTVGKSSVSSNIAMLSALREQLEGYQFKWSCAKGPVVARTNAVLQLAETGTSLLMRERSTVAALIAELRVAEESSAQVRSEVVAALQQSIAQGYEESNLELRTLVLDQLRSASPVAASALVALENTLRTDAAEAKRLAARFVDTGSAYSRASDELLQTSKAKDSELKQAQRVLSDARSRAASGRDEVAKEPGCSEAVRTSGLLAAVSRALDILQD